MMLRTVPGLAAPVETNTAAPLDVPGARRLSIVNGKPQPAFNLPQGVRVDTVPGSVLTQRDDVLVRLNAALTVGGTQNLTLGGVTSGTG